MKIMTVNLTMVKFFVNATQLLLSSSENFTVNLSIVTFFVNATQLLLSSGEKMNKELNHN